VATLSEQIPTYEGTAMEMTVYVATLDRARATNEIAVVDWFSPTRSFAGVPAPAVADFVVPSLVTDGLL
jgi:hypothetical protein